MPPSRLTGFLARVRVERGADFETEVLVTVVFETRFIATARLADLALPFFFLTGVTAWRRVDPQTSVIKRSVKRVQVRRVFKGKASLSTFKLY